MTIPRKIILQNMDYSFFGAPFVSVIAKEPAHLESLDYSFFATPFYVAYVQPIVDGGVYFNTYSYLGTVPPLDTWLPPFPKQ